ncbi:hypothetical protein SASPL_111291 [Salvia splendens]|uniref:Uncharacterized protein n=1 Tax=Salvia splendens TaxID=180675 RepID=A0A8X9A291_SALSN|nr:hypothetical protein SASPL_111291 [Salvia splendens]
MNEQRTRLLDLPWKTTQATNDSAIFLMRHKGNLDNLKAIGLQGASVRILQILRGRCCKNMLLAPFNIAKESHGPLCLPKLKTSHLLFITSSSVMFHHFKNPDTEFPYKNIREREKGSVGVNKSCKIVLIKGFRGIEGRYIDYVSGLTGKRFVPVGPLVQKPSIDDAGNSEVLSWLDKKEAKSTVFVSFGSEYFLSKEDMDGIALGLLLSKVNFIWVVRFPEGVMRNGCLEKKFPEGFLAKVVDRGLVGHCGWNSVMESLKFGVPIIAVPMHLDQPINARLVEEVSLGTEVLRDRDGRLNAETAAAVINHVVVEDGGGDVRGKADDIKTKLNQYKAI